MLNLRREELLYTALTTTTVNDIHETVFDSNIVLPTKVVNLLNHFSVILMKSAI